MIEAVLKLVTLCVFEIDIPVLIV